MKADLNRAQVFWVGVGSLGLIVAVGLAWFGLSGLGEKRAEAQALADRIADPALGELLASGAGLDKVSREASEIQKMEKELREKVGSRSAGWAAAARLANGDGQDWAKDPGRCLFWPRTSQWPSDWWRNSWMPEKPANSTPRSVASKNSPVRGRRRRLPY